MKHIYIHIPFCTKKCHYCDFNTYAIAKPDVDTYLNALECEIKHAAMPGEIKSIFIGGGTPTVLSPTQLTRLGDMLRNYFPNWSKDIEFTTEANPETTTLEKLEALVSRGLNRLSFGVQTFQPELLKTLGRQHVNEQVYEGIEAAKKVGIKNYSIDLMFGLPGQTLSHLEEDIDSAIQLGIQHLSSYSLKIEENTFFHQLFRKEKLSLPEEETELNMYLLLMKKMKQAGFIHYEISNFAKPGFASRHNMAYWKNQSYYGFGAGAHGFLNGVRYVNKKLISDYQNSAKDPKYEIYEEPVIETMENFMMLGLRLEEGVHTEEFFECFQQKMEEVFATEIEKLLSENLIFRTSTGYALTAQGILFGNEVFARFLHSVNA